ncbi:efflux RND transporter periplasmic adaptor subunit [Hydrogenovibrio sp. 3SP14C1]|uniref:efflux RND transporter periplasmic adaptor subunit n=1 Tax=Hydrogenovibrio sp. 3SP14C1 TaxID=3038774 RepID=UPI0024161CDE|nr:efflux RND transporter periplasmic adaptor subunit [Hydrogenovibrio sp. 3SP14C1]MDG4811595.1 efflux RND transporter periplasmic adaptor subunit [Hydrogenovibrio sp. 3SP14C1]
MKFFNPPSTFFLHTLLWVTGLMMPWQSQAANTLTLAPEKQAFLGIQTASVKSLTSFPGKTYPGETILPPNQTFLVTSPLSGMVTKVIHIHGPVKKGEVIAEVQSPELLKAQKNFLNTISDLKAAQADLNRAKKLSQSGVVSTKKYQQAEANLKKNRQIKYQQKQDLALLGMADSAIRQLEKTHRLQPAIIQITAPEAGELYDLKIRSGQRLSTNQAIISVAQITPIVVEAKIPLKEAQQLSMEQTAQLVEPAVNGKIEYIPNFTDPMTQTVNVHIEFDNQEQSLRPGQMVQLQFIFEQQDGSFLYQVNRDAISQYNNQDVVYLQQAEHIQVIPVEVLNFSQTQMFFKTTQPLPQNAQIIISSTSAVKGLLDVSSEGGK